MYTPGAYTNPMNATLRISALIVALAVALVACSQYPLNIPLKDFSITVDAAAPTAGKVLYPKDAATFQRSVINIKSISLTGDLTFTSAAGSNQLTLTLYARTEDPSASCHAYGSFYLCDSSGEKAVSKQITLENGQAHIELGAPNPDVLAAGINQGKIWIGALVESGVALGSTFEFRNMAAHVVVF